MRMHYGQSVANAWWDGVKVTIGNGDSWIYPLGTLEIIAHEVRTSRLEGKRVTKALFSSDRPRHDAGHLQPHVLRSVWRP